MSAHAKVIPMPEPTYRESITRQGNWTAVPMPILRHMIDRWYETRAEGERAPEWIAEAECIYWNDLGKMKPARYLEKRWGWGHRQTLEFLGERGLKKEPKRNQSGTNQEPIKPAPEMDSAKKEPKRNQSGTNQEPVLPDSEEERVKHVGETRATAPPQTPPPKPIDPWNPHHAPPDLDAVIGHGAKIGVSATDAEEFYHHYTAAGWRAGNGNAIAHWGSKLKSWSLDTKRKGTNNGTPNQRPGGKPQSSFERRMDPGLADRVRVNREKFLRATGLDRSDGGAADRDGGSGGLGPLPADKRLPG
jgi:hypothetical protein